MRSFVSLNLKQPSKSIVSRLMMVVRPDYSDYSAWMDGIVISVPRASSQETLSANQFSTDQLGALDWSALASKGKRKSSPDQSTRLVDQAARRSRHHCGVSPRPPHFQPRGNEPPRDHSPLQRGCSTGWRWCGVDSAAPSHFPA